MNSTHAPIIVAGQIFLNGPLNEYLIVTKNNLGQIYYSGVGFNGQAEDLTFIEHFGPVNPIDVDIQELKELLSLCPAGTKASTGYIEQG